MSVELNWFSADSADRHGFVNTNCITVLRLNNEDRTSIKLLLLCYYHCYNDYY